MTPVPLLLVGAGGHARACIDVIETLPEFSVAGLLGVPEEIGSQVLGYPVVGGDADLSRLMPTYSHALVAVGQIKSAHLRVRLFEALRQLGYSAPTIVSPHARVSPHATIGDGTIVLHGATINAGAAVGRNCIINTHSLVEHDAVVGDHCHISTGAILNSAVRVADMTFVGSGSIVRQGIAIGSRCVIGMGQSVLTDCPDGSQLPLHGRLK